MRYLFIDTLGVLTVGYPVLRSPPEGLGLSYYRVAKGAPIDDRYPADARVTMSDEESGIARGAGLVPRA
jgi:hypothetical protein